MRKVANVITSDILAFGGKDHFFVKQAALEGIPVQRWLVVVLGNDKRMGMHYAAPFSLSQINRGSKLCAASIVKMTDMPKKKMPGPGSMPPSASNLTRLARSPTTKTSSIDQ